MRDAILKNAMTLEQAVGQQFLLTFEGKEAPPKQFLEVLRRQHVSLRPLWGIDDPAAGAWFPQQALQLAQDASPSLG